MWYSCWTDQQAVEGQARMCAFGRTKRCCLPSNFLTDVKTTVLAGMLRPIEKVSVAKSTCGETDAQWRTIDEHWNCWYEGYRALDSIVRGGRWRRGEGRGRRGRGKGQMGFLVVRRLKRLRLVVNTP